MVELHLIGKGRVQGVFFRATSRDRAKALGLTGWVKNLDNGDVELIAQGEEPALQELVTALKEQFDAEFTPKYRAPAASYQDFSIHY